MTNSFYGEASVTRLVNSAVPQDRRSNMTVAASAYLSSTVILASPGQVNFLPLGGGASKRP